MIKWCCDQNGKVLGFPYHDGWIVEFSVSVSENGNTIRICVEAVCGETTWMELSGVSAFQAKCYYPNLSIHNILMFKWTDVPGIYRSELDAETCDYLGSTNLLIIEAHLGSDIYIGFDELRAFTRARPPAASPGL